MPIGFQQEGSGWAAEQESTPVMLEWQWEAENYKGFNPPGKLSFMLAIESPAQTNVPCYGPARWLRGTAKTPVNLIDLGAGRLGKCIGRQSREGQGRTM